VLPAGFPEGPRQEKPPSMAYAITILGPPGKIFSAFPAVDKSQNVSHNVHMHTLGKTDASL
jgi:hypothetical protein